MPKERSASEAPVPALAENHTPHNKRVWEYHMNELMKTERILRGNLCNLFAVLMSLCDSDMKNCRESSTENAEIEEELDTLKLLTMIKKLVYTGSTHDLNICHNKAMAHMNLMNLYQDKFQDIQEFGDQYIAMQKVCDELGLRFGRCNDDALAILRKKGIVDH